MRTEVLTSLPIRTTNNNEVPMYVGTKHNKAGCVVLKMCMPEVYKHVSEKTEVYH